MDVLCCTLGTQHYFSSCMDIFQVNISAHFFDPERLISFPDTVCKSWNRRLIWCQRRSEGGHAGGLKSCSNISSGGICTFWAAVTCWSGVHVFLFMCTPTHKLTWCIDVYELLCGHKTPWTSRRTAAFILLCVSGDYSSDYWWACSIVWSDQIINVMEWQRLCWQTSCFHNESFCLFQPQNPKITYRLSPCFPLVDGYYCSVDQFILCGQGWS